MYGPVGSFTGMKTNKQAVPVHRGEVLKKAAEESGLSIETIVERMRYASRSTFYNHIQKPDLSLDMLRRYGKVLNYNFYDDIPEMTTFPAQEPAFPAFYIAAPKTMEEAIRQRDFYYQQYMLRLEDYRKLQEELYELKVKMKMSQ